MEAEINAQILMMANEYFVNRQQIYEYNLLFLNRYRGKVNYLCWKGAEHVHQTDWPFISGSSLNVIKNHHLCAEMFNRNT